MTYQEIANELGYRSRQSAFDAVKFGLQKMLREPAEEVRTLELARLDAMLQSLWPAISAPLDPGDIDFAKKFESRCHAIDRVDKIMKRRSALLGLDMPVKRELSGPGGGPIQAQTVVEIDWSKATDDQLRRIIALVAENECSVEEP